VAYNATLDNVFWLTSM